MREERAGGVGEDMFAGVEERDTVGMPGDEDLEQ
jgi:hypothetical protein